MYYIYVICRVSRRVTCKKLKTKFIPRTGVTITLKLIDDLKQATPVKSIASVSIQPTVNNNKEELKKELIANIKRWQSEIENKNSENINNYIESSLSFFQGTKIGDRNDEDKQLAAEIKNTITFIRDNEMLYTDYLEPKIRNKFDAIEKGIRTKTFGGSKNKKSYKKTSKKITKRKKSLKNKK